MRVHASSRKQDAVAGFCQRGGARIAVVAAACNDDSCNARIGCALQHRVSIIIETVMRQVGANINQRITHGSKLFPTEYPRTDGEKNGT